MADVIYNGFLQYIADGTIDLDTNEIMCCILDSNYTPDVDAHDNYGDLTHEVSGDNYTAGGQALVNSAMTHSDSLNAGVWDADDPEWAAVFITGCRFAVFYKNAVNVADRKLICAKDFGGDKNVLGVKFRVQLPTAGILVFGQSS